MINSTFPIIAGILASLLHVLTGPDHLAAVTPIVVRSNRKAWKIGLTWGVGHISGMLLIGVLFLIFKDFIPVNTISEYSEQMVGVVLIIIGIWSFYKIFRESKPHKHPHIHSEDKIYVHIHKHKHDHQHQTHSHKHEKQTDQKLWASTGIGFIHGIAGVAHFILLLPVLGFESKLESIQYIIGFAIGTLIAMTTYAFVLGNISKYSKQQHNKLFFKGIQLAGGLFAFIIGVYWLI